MDEPEQIKLRTWLCSVVFVDMVGYSARPVEVQMTWKRRFNRYLAAAIEGLMESDRVMLDTGDGAAVCFLGDPEAAMFSTLRLLDSLLRDEQKQPDPMRVRIGINLGSVKLVKDINGNLNAVGDGINVAQRVMSFAQENQILVSRSFYEVVSCLSDSYNQMFQFQGVRKDKHVREHTVYDLRPPGAPPPHPAQSQSVEAVPVAAPVAPVTAARPLDPALVARAEAALSPILGPIARRLVEAHAARSHTAAELTRALLDLIPDKRDQEQFVRAFASGVAAAPAKEAVVPQAAALPMLTAVSPPSTAPTATEANSAPVPWDPGVLDRARADLAVYMGPMARVIVNRAAARAQTLKQLYDLLASEIPSAGDREKFRKGSRGRG
jgi:class 3 adenylate cyclase